MLMSPQGAAPCAVMRGIHSCAYSRMAFALKSTGADTSVVQSDVVKGVCMGGKFTKLGSMLVQPLYAPHVRVSKGVYKNIMIIATEFNSVYGFDAGGCWLPS